MECLKERKLFNQNYVVKAVRQQYAFAATLGEDEVMYAFVWVMLLFSSTTSNYYSYRVFYDENQEKHTVVELASRFNILMQEVPFFYK